MNRSELFIESWTFPESGTLIFSYLLLLLLLSCQSCLTLCDPIDNGPPGSHPWDSPGKHTGVGCHFLLQCIKVKSESESLSYLTLRDPMDCSLPGSSVHGISQARVLEWVAITFSDHSILLLLLLLSRFSHVRLFATP